MPAEYPSISVIVPSYNQGQFIEETLISIVNQQYPNLELLVLDGGSTDNTVEVIEKYANHITYWHSQKDNGQADAINQGIRSSSGQIVCWLNSDDMYLPGTLLDIGKRFRGFEDQCHLVYGDCFLLYEDAQKQQSGGVKPAQPFDAFTLTYYDYMIQPSSFWTRKLWDQVGDLNSGYHFVLDWDWFIRASQITQFEYVSRYYSIYRMHSSHKTSSGGLTRQKEILEIVGKYSSTYWLNLFEAVGASYPDVRAKSKWLGQFSIPKRHELLPLFFPQLWSKLQDAYHLTQVLEMYG